MPSESGYVKRHRRDIDKLAATVEKVLNASLAAGDITEMQRRTRKRAYTQSLNKLRQHTTMLESIIAKNNGLQPGAAQ